MTPLKPVAIRIGKNEEGRNSGMSSHSTGHFLCLFFFVFSLTSHKRYLCLGYVYVDLRSEEEVERALRMNKDYMGKCPNWQTYLLTWGLRRS